MVGTAWLQITLAGLPLIVRISEEVLDRRMNIALIVAVNSVGIELNQYQVALGGSTGGEDAQCAALR